MSNIDNLKREAARAERKAILAKVRRMRDLYMHGATFGILSGLAKWISARDERARKAAGKAK